MGIRTHHLGQIAVLGFTLVFSSAPAAARALLDSKENADPEGQRAPVEEKYKVLDVGN